MIRLEGIFPPLPTPFDENEEIYPDGMKENIRSLLQHDLSGILVLGSNGELVMLSEYEKEKVYSIARSAVPTGRFMIAGCGGQSTRETIHLCRLAEKHNADAALVLNPSYYKGLMTPDLLVQFYHEVADGSGIPVIIYNMPANTGIDMDADTLIRAAMHPNIIGLKDSGNDIDKMKKVVDSCSDSFSLLIGSANNFYPALEIGARGGILAFANLFPGIVLELFNAFNRQDLSRARRIQESVVELNTKVTRRWGVPALKAAMERLGLYGGPARKPLLPLDAKRLEELNKLMDPFVQT